jgi:two-component system cell cycle sensor histidine kinase/response regulator CckA
VTARTEPRQDWDRDGRYQQLVELAPDAILVHDGERIVLANAAAARLAGASSREQLVGLPIDTFLEPPHLKAVQTELRDSITPAEPAPPVRDTFRRLDGSEVEVEVRAVAFMDGDRPSAHLVLRDISERLAAAGAIRQMEHQLQQAQRMEAVGALAGGVAHEVNNMMTVVLGFSNSLVWHSHLPKECLADVREIMKAADRAAAVTRQLLAFSRRAVHRPQMVDLGAAMREAEPVVRRLLGGSRRLVLEVDAAHAAHQVWVDPSQLQQVVIDLALNARDAMPDGGTLTITTGETELPSGVAAADKAEIPAGRYAVVVVRDTGEGMDAATRERIFEPFFTTKAIGHGTGLGLAAVHGVLTQNHGYIAVVSEPGGGTAFTLYLPALTDFVTVVPHAAPPGTGADAALPAATAPHAGATVLVVDDESAVRAITSRSLERAGFSVLQALNGADALELVDQLGPPDLVLTDLMMPGVGGAQLARILKERWPELPILFMSGYSADELRGQDAIGSVGELIQKPFTPRALVETVTLALSH